MKNLTMLENITTHGRHVRVNGFDNFMNKSTNTNWAIFKNCSYFSSRAFNYTTGLNVTAHPFMIPIHTPSWLVRTILSK